MQKSNSIVIMTLLDKLTSFDYKKLATNVVGGLALGTALLFMTSKDLNAQAIVEGSVVISESHTTSYPLVEYKLASDTTQSYVKLGSKRGNYSINNMVITDILDDEQRRVTADGTVATNMQTGNGRRMFYAAIGESNSAAIAYNSIGQQVAKFKTEYDAATGITKASVDPSSWADGVYFIVFKGQENAGASKFIQLSNNKYANENITGKELLKTTRTRNNNNLSKILDDATPYIVSITQTDSSSFEFKPLREERILHDGYNGIFIHTVEPITFDNIDITTTIRSSMKPWNTLEGVTVEMYTTKDSLINFGTTDENGILIIEDFPVNESVRYKIGGKDGYFARNGMTLFMAYNPEDSTKEFSFMLPPMRGVVPGTNGVDSVDFNIDEINELFRYFDITASKSDGIRYYIWPGLDENMFDTRLAAGCELFGVDPEIFIRVGQRIVLDNEEANAYIAGTDTTNYFGWNIKSGGDFTNNGVFKMSDDDYASFGGEMIISGAEKSFYKEIFGRLFGMNDVYSRESYMNSDASLPTHKDRAYYKLLNDFRIGRWTHSNDSKSLRNYIAQDISSEPLRKTEELEQKIKESR